MAFYYPITNDANEVVCRLRISELPYTIGVRRQGYRKFEWLPKRYRTQAQAFARLCRLFASGKYKRGVVVSNTGAPWHDPRVVQELSHRDGWAYR